MIIQLVMWRVSETAILGLPLHVFSEHVHVFLSETV